MPRAVPCSGTNRNDAPDHRDVPNRRGSPNAAGAAALGDSRPGHQHLDGATRFPLALSGAAKPEPCRERARDRRCHSSISASAPGRVLRSGSTRRWTRATASPTRPVLPAISMPSPARWARPIRTIRCRKPFSARPLISAARPKRWPPISTSSAARKRQTGWCSPSANSR